MSQKSLKILLADDDDEDLELIEESILHAMPGTQFLKAKDGKDALVLLSGLQDHELPNIMVMDFNMPELNGLQLLTQLRDYPRFSTIPKVILSTSGAPLHIHECKLMGASEYFVKPNTKKDLDLLAEKILKFCNA
jgi:CheY-like chemotaxis protein